MSPFLRPTSYYESRFHRKQEDAWLAYKGGLDLVMDWGRRSGKSELITECFVEDVEEYGKDCMYCALTQTQGREIMWPKFEKAIGGKRNWRSNESRLEWKHKPTGAIISIKGFDQGVDKLRGNAKRLIALDEWAFVRQRLKGRKGKAKIAVEPTIVKEVFAPQLTDYNGQMFYMSTPKGKNHFWRLKQRALKDPAKFYTSHCTVFENPFIPAAGRDKLIAEYTGPDDPLYRQEILAEYIDFQGLVFALPQDSYIEDKWQLGDLEHSYHWRGMDHGFSPDPTACLWIAYNRRKGYFQVYSEYKQEALLIHRHAEVITRQEPYRFVDSISDIDPQLIAEYEAVGLSLTPAGKYDKESRLLRLVNALKMGKVKIARHCKQLLDEMLVYEWDQDGNDHLIDAFNYGFTNLVVPEEFQQEAHEQRRNPNANPHAQDFGD